MEQRLYDPKNPPPWLDPAWWADTPNCDHLAHPAGVHRARIEFVANLAVELFSLGLVRDVVDMGAGDGAVLWKIKGQAGAEFPAWGYEIIKDSVRVARDERGVEVRRADVVNDTVFTHTNGRGRLQWADLVICTEMLEHLEDPHAWARTMAVNAAPRGPARVGGGEGWLIASSPWKETVYQHEPNHAWCWDMAGYRAMLTAAGWYVVEQHQVEWSQVVLACRRPDDAQRLRDARGAAADDRWPTVDQLAPNAIAQSVRPS